MMKLNRKVFKQYKSNLVMTLRFSAVISLIMVLIYGLTCIVLATVFQYEMTYFEYIIVIVFSAMMISIIQPFLYSYFALTVVLNDDVNNDKVTMTGFFKTAAIGNNKAIKGTMGIFSTFVYSILIYVGLSLILSVATFSILYAVNPDFASFFTEAMSLSQSLDYEGLTELLSDNSQLVNTPMMFIEFFSIFGGFWYFLHRMGVNIFKYYLGNIARTLPKGIFNSIFNSVIKTKRKDFFKRYYGITWIFLIVIVIIFPTSYFLIYYFNIHNGSYLVLGMTSMVITLLFLFPLLPLLFNTYESMIDEYEVYYLDSINKKIDSEIELLKKNYDSFSPEEKAQVDALIANQKNTINSLSKEHFRDLHKGVDETEDDDKDNDKK